jgi:hypothetical protein
VVVVPSPTAEASSLRSAIGRQLGLRPAYLANGATGRYWEGPRAKEARAKTRHDDTKAQSRRHRLSTERYNSSQDQVARDGASMAGL